MFTGLEYRPDVPVTPEEDNVGSLSWLRSVRIAHKGEGRCTDQESHKFS